jgi:hypothetical protein
LTSHLSLHGRPYHFTTQARAGSDSRHEPANRAGACRNTKDADLDFRLTPAVSRDLDLNPDRRIWKSAFDLEAELQLARVGGRGWNHRSAVRVRNRRGRADAIG